MADNNQSEKKSSPEKKKGMSRRDFMKNTGLVAGSAIGGSLLGGLIVSQRDTDSKTAKPSDKKEPAFQEARMFFTRAEDFKVLEMATERIYPEDDNGPGAIGLGVPYFIDKQLAGAWGINARDYRKGPFKPVSSKEGGKETEVENLPPNPKGAQGQGKTSEKSVEREQTSLIRRDIFLEGLRKMNQVSRDQYKDTFDKLTEEQQIEILQMFEKGEVEMKGVTAANFFVLLRKVTLEGAYADPLYGGNKNMEGWRMKEFPGAYPAYAGYIEKDEFFKLDPISLTNSQH